MPHITLVRYSKIAPDRLRHAAMQLEGENAISLTFDRIGVFGGDPIALWLWPRASQRLVDFHAKLHHAIDPALCDPHYRPSSWIPHLTIAMAIPPARRTEALELASRPLEPFALTFDAVDCVSWPPVRLEHKLRLTDEQLLVLSPDEEAAHAAAEHLFKMLEREIRRHLPPSAEVLHVGATSIAGCLTKGDLDILVRVEKSDFAAAESYFASRLSRNEGSARTHEFASFEGADRTPKLGVQLTVKGGELDVFHLFAEALRADAALVRRYNALKLSYQNKPMTQYRAAKDAFINKVLQSERRKPSPRTKTPDAAD